jgi:hypothetical protein
MSIIQESDREGVVPTSRKYNLSPGLLYKWKERLAANGQLMCNKNQKTDFSYMNGIK